MKLLVRTMRDKYGSRQHIIFTEESGISKPMAVLDTTALNEFIEMYETEQALMDQYVLKDKK